jgi:hypothetical protein
MYYNCLKIKYAGTFSPTEEIENGELGILNNGELVFKRHPSNVRVVK